MNNQHDASRAVAVDWGLMVLFQNLEYLNLLR